MALKDKNIYVTGLGAVSSQGTGLEPALASLWGSDASAGKNRPSERGVNERLILEGADLSSEHNRDRSFRYAMLATQEAMRTAGLLDIKNNKTKFDPMRTGLAISAGPTLSYPEAPGRDSEIIPTPNSTAGKDTGPYWLEGLGICGCTDNCHKDSDRHLLQTALDTINNDAADIMIVGGADVVVPSSDTTGKSVSENTVLPGEGAACMVIESREALIGRNNEPICRIAAIEKINACPRSGHGESDPAESVLQGIEDILAGADMWEGDLGAIFVTSHLNGCQSKNDRITEEAMKHFAGLPVYPVSPCMGDIHASALPLQCSLASMLVQSQTVHLPPLLTEVKNGVELWVEYQPGKLLGEAVMVIDTSGDDLVATLLAPTRF